ncbi:hypothetical protein BN7_5661 [Wickerhamomyces ciferrii]|uniref:Uncharacterized protein n=1 Tax=Wickerhamomyces ciferrii (strain ATCC 14091 / BCRC 22168 / CBS 111 / JCM 3599 / NBRC 0793 / NRRL Y-1031 F-60-10) TaxID=1206466 RepID=K0KY98_WICCF|nr:uncharacterized protein BN7_5661 [Wickerhamomyces ciferrii]CCH46073.1 hypothetical protein BN7_5661 [Wickerhamomyces ciferrii]
MEPVKESDLQEEAHGGSDNDNGINKYHHNRTKNEKKLIEKLHKKMNYRIIPLIPAPGQNTINPPLISCPWLRSKIQNFGYFPFFQFQSKPSKFYNLKRPSQSPNYKSLFVRTSKESIPVKLFYFMRSQERLNPILVKNLNDPMINFNFYFRPAMNNSIKIDSDLRQHLIDSFTQIILDYHMKEDALESSSGQHAGPYRFKPNGPKIIFPKGVKTFNQIKLCLAFQPNKEPLLQTLETFINILDFGGELKEIDAFAYTFENDSHKAFLIHCQHIHDGNELSFSNLVNNLFSTTVPSNDCSSTSDPVYFIPGQSTYDLVDPPPPSYQK